MKCREVVRTLLASVMILGLGLAVTPSAQPDPPIGGRLTLSLQRPPFLSTVNAQTDPDQLDIGEYLDDEAGIAAWCETDAAIDLDLVRDQYQIIEIETETYILGSVSVPNYTYDEWDQHVYVHTDGWIVAYYMNTDPAGKIIDLHGRTVDSTLVENMVQSMAGEASTYCTAAYLYDFRYPNATHMLFIAEDDANGSTYTLYMPTSYAYMDRGWAKWNDLADCGFKIDGAQPTVTLHLGEYCIGPVTYAQLLPGVTHTIDVDARGNYADYGVIFLTYAVP